MARHFSSSLKDDHLAKFRKLYDIPENVVLYVPRALEQDYIADDEVYLYKETLVSGFRFPITHFIRELDHAGLALA